MKKVDEVFGISTKIVASYVERIQVDDRFLSALDDDKHIVVYGASKQGKTALVSKHLPYEQNIVVSLSPKTTAQDIYSSILRASGIQILESTVSESGTEASLRSGMKVKALLPFLGSGEVSVDSSAKGSRNKKAEFAEIPFNLELPQDISDLLRKVENKKAVILENFHYLTEDIQRQLSFDLRSFQELGLKFVVLGVWREKNRLIQFNGDLLDRIVEVPVEPWGSQDLKDVVAKGAPLLNVTFNSEIVDRCIQIANGSVGIFQEFLKGLCLAAGDTFTSHSVVPIKSNAWVEDIIREKLDHYSSRHQRALETISESIRPKLNAAAPPLFLHYYLVKVILLEKYEAIKAGMHRNMLQEKIKGYHHRPEGVRPADIANLLHTIADHQYKKGISPPIFDYDRSFKRLQVVDSTFFFFLKHANREEIISEIPSPLDLLE